MRTRRVCVREECLWVKSIDCKGVYKRVELIWFECVCGDGGVCINLLEYVKQSTRSTCDESERNGHFI